MTCSVLQDRIVRLHLLLVNKKLCFYAFITRAKLSREACQMIMIATSDDFQRRRLEHFRRVLEEEKLDQR